MNSKAKQGTDFEAASSENKSVRYGFGTATFNAPVLGRTAARFPRKRAHLMVRTDRTAAVQLQQILGTFFLEVRTAFNVVTVRTVRLFVHRFRGGCVWVSSSHFQARKTRKR
jgi:hypothetical protein